MEKGSTFYDIVSSKCELGLGEMALHEHEEHQSSPVRYFFYAVWQTQPAVYRSTHECCPPIATKSWLLQTLNMTWDDIAALLSNCRHHHPSTGTPPPLLFQNGSPIDDPHALYSSNPHAAYLDGCSIIINHADFHHSIIAQLCDSLQATFPHVYANTYLTPANSHAVKAHADDRDVLVVQILGKKKWKVYRKVPVDYPFDKEQVGKNGNDVDSTVLSGGLCFKDKEVILCPGDVLYLPRGYVHEATTVDSNDDTSGCCDPSFHATIAIATHDWCISSLLSETIRQTLNDVTKFRMALPIGPCDLYENSKEGASPLVEGLSSSSLQQQLDEAMSTIQSKVTPLLLEKKLRAKYQMHNVHASEHRHKLSLTQQSKKRKTMDEPKECVGPNAAAGVTLQSVIRVSTIEERSSITMEEGRMRGLTVREETMAILMEVLGKLKSDPAFSVIVKDARGLVHTGDDESEKIGMLMVCDFTLLSFARCCVELGALALVQQ